MTPEAVECVMRALGYWAARSDRANLVFVNRDAPTKLRIIVLAPLDGTMDPGRLLTFLSSRGLDRDATVQALADCLK